MGLETTPSTPSAPAPVATPATPEIKKVDAPAGGAKLAAPATDELETYVVDGKTIRLTPKQRIAAVQKGLFADQQLKSLDVIKGKTAALIESLKTPDGLMRVLKDPALGANPKEVLKRLLESEDLLDDDVKESIAKVAHKAFVVEAQKTPEQRAAEAQAAELASYKKAEADRKQLEEDTRLNAEMQAIYDSLLNDIRQHVKNDPSFPQTPDAIRAVWNKLRLLHKNGMGMTKETFEKAVQAVKKDHILNQHILFDSITDDEKLIEAFGEARALRMSRALVARHKAKAKANIPVEKTVENTVREKVTDRIDKKLGKTPHGYHVLDI